MHKIKAYNTVTGLWFIHGQGFSGETKENASLLDEVEANIVRLSFLNVRLTLA
jgi:hypothetical protein